MMNTLTKTFNFEDSVVRTAGTFEKPLFCVKDVCAMLGVKNHLNKVSLLDEDEKLSIQSLDAQNRTRPTTFCTEPGLYRIIFSCQRNPKTEPIKRWVFHEVLPSIRKTGEYKLKQDLAEVSELLEQTQNILARIQSEKNQADQNFDMVADRHAWTRILAIRNIESGSFLKSSARHKRMCRLVARLKIDKVVKWKNKKPYFVSEAAIQEYMDVIQNWRL
jgi:prophage antirepressor-like protein